MTSKVKFCLFLSIIMIVGIITHTILNTGTTLYNNIEDMTATITNEVDPYDTEYVYIENMPSNAEPVVLVEGVNGLDYTYDGLNYKHLSDKQNQVLQVGSGKQGEYTGKLTGYGPDCPGCSGRVGWGQNVTGGNIYYNDATYGRIRIVAGDRSLPFGTIIRVVNSNAGVPFYAIVLDRGGDIGVGRRYMFDLLFASEADASRWGLSKNTTFEIVRYGY